ncbi:ABC transporter ATP-binding protein [Amycolatopsis saalfeldensis]|uniref:ABC transporter n=1 Tax=Amycolatopsis saalfeldensis TaxID=394193 RepID=A0A1H8RJB6_9PSEU|nr:ABC transporter ATP-binding protein [Amycolatopsis saalfeldensis]SEO66412.1 ABC transporter [Amycolatopsis saalfeldensis]
MTTIDRELPAADWPACREALRPLLGQVPEDAPDGPDPVTAAAEAGGWRAVRVSPGSTVSGTALVLDTAGRAVLLRSGRHPEPVGARAVWQLYAKGLDRPRVPVAVVVTGLLAALVSCASAMLSVRYGWLVPVLAALPIILLLGLRDRLAADAQHRLQSTVEPALWDLLLDPARTGLRTTEPELRAAATTVVSRLRTLVAAAALDALLVTAMVAAAFFALLTVSVGTAWAVLPVAVAGLVALARSARGPAAGLTGDGLDQLLTGTDEIHLYAAERRMLARLRPERPAARPEPRSAAVAAAIPFLLLATVLGIARADVLLAACAVLAQLFLVLGRSDNTVRSVFVVGGEAVRGIRALLAAAKATEVPTLALDLIPGEFVVITGPSGAGKTTLLDRLSAADRGRTGYLRQDADLPRGTVRTVVLGRSPAADDQAWAALGQAGLAEVIRGLPMGLSTVVSGGAGGFSASQLKLLQLARAFARRPRLLLLDEPPDTIAEVVRDQEGVTRVVVSRSPRFLDVADRVLVLGDDVPTNTETRWGNS